MRDRNVTFPRGGTNTSFGGTIAGLGLAILSASSTVASPVDHENYRFGSTGAEQSSPKGGLVVFPMDATIDYRNVTSASRTKEPLLETRAEKWRDALIKEISELSDLPANWDGEDSVVPSDEVIEDALVIAQDWPNDLPAPEPTPTIDGNIVLEMYDDDGFAIGSIEVMAGGDVHYAVVDRTTLKLSRSVRTGSQLGLLEMFKEMRTALA